MSEPTQAPGTHPAAAARGPEALRAAFEAGGAFTVGLEEELILVDAESLAPAPHAAAVLERLADSNRFKPELPASQMEIVTGPHSRLADAVGELASGRRQLLAAAGDLRALASAVHPFAPAEAELSDDPRYAEIRAEYGPIARRQLVSSLHVHVAAGGADRSLAVYNGLRSHLPEIAALAANAPFHDGADTGLASVRPKIAELLPRQGVPPAFADWRELAAALDWSAAAGAAPTPRYWWFELRLHPGFGTIEVRVADAQPALADQAAVAAVIQSLVAMLAARHDGGEPLGGLPRHRIEENRWSAARHGVEGEMADLESGEREPTRERLARLLDQLDPHAARLGCGRELEWARRLIAENGAIRQRRIAAEAGGELRALTARLCDAFQAGLEPTD